MSSPQSTTGASRAVRELASRESDGLRVRLLWHPQENALTVSVDDSRAGQRFELDVEGDRGLHAFYHPFACAISRRPERSMNVPA
jgi:hypothetical protein